MRGLEEAGPADALGAARGGPADAAAARSRKKPGQRTLGEMKQGQSTRGVEEIRAGGGAGPADAQGWMKHGLQTLAQSLGVGRSLAG
jgi:hypothetical protein